MDEDFKTMSNEDFQKMMEQDRKERQEQKKREMNRMKWDRMVSEQFAQQDMRNSRRS